MATSARRWPETTYTYDPNGNLASKIEGTDSWVYEWNANNELTRASRNNIEQARFSYDPFGRRVEKIAGGVTSSYTYDGDDILREVSGSTTLKFVHGRGFDEPLAADDGNALSYNHADGLGSMVKATNAAGAVMFGRQFDAWGNPEIGASDSGYAFTGREWDPQAGLYYYRARYYDPKIGRFLSEDPIGFAGGANLYRYAAGNPLSYVDPFGWADLVLLGPGELRDASMKIPSPDGAIMVIAHGSPWAISDDRVGKTYLSPADLARLIIVAAKASGRDWGRVELLACRGGTPSAPGTVYAEQLSEELGKELGVSGVPVYAADGTVLIRTDAKYLVAPYGSGRDYTGPDLGLTRYMGPTAKVLHVSPPF